MSIFKFSMCALALGLGGLSGAACAQSLDKPFTVVEPEQIQWKDAGKGVRFAVISGDPSKPVT